MTVDRRDGDDGCGRWSFVVVVIVFGGCRGCRLSPASSTLSCVVRRCVLCLSFICVSSLLVGVLSCPSRCSSVVSCHVAVDSGCVTALVGMKDCCVHRQSK
jgi:hypothetical protein